MSVSTGCTTIEPIDKDHSYESILIGMIPPLPSIPPFPALSWKYNDGRYSIDEEDVDKLLDYGENKLPLYRYRMDVFRKSLEIVKNALKRDMENLDNASL